MIKLISKKNNKKFIFQIITFQLTEVGTIIFDNLLAIDLDSGHNGLVEYSTGETLVSNINSFFYQFKKFSNFFPNFFKNDAFNFFAIKMPHQGLVTLQKSLDYEKSKQHFLVVVASVS